MAAVQVLVWHGLHVVELLAGMGRRGPWQWLREDDGGGDEQDDGRAKGYYYLFPRDRHGRIGLPGNGKGEQRDEPSPVSRWSALGLALVAVLVLAAQVYLWELVFSSSRRVDRVGLSRSLLLQVVVAFFP
jgi:hypothetical protein